LRLHPDPSGGAASRPCGLGQAHYPMKWPRQQLGSSGQPEQCPEILLEAGCGSPRAKQGKKVRSHRWSDGGSARPGAQRGPAVGACMSPGRRQVASCERLILALVGRTLKEIGQGRTTPGGCLQILNWIMPSSSSFRASFSTSYRLTRASDWRVETGLKLDPAASPRRSRIMR